MSLDYGLCLGAEDREYTAEEFCSALHAVFGDGICKYGAGFGLTLGGFDLNISTGYAAAAGRYVKNTDTFTATLGPSSNTEDRYDALAVRVDYPGRRAALDVIQNVDPDAIRADPVLVRNSTEYCVILYFIHVRRGATTLSPNDVEDVRSDGGLCGNVVPLAEASGNVLYIYRYLTEGIDEKAGQLMQDSERILQKAADAVERIDAILEDKGITPVIGEVRTAVEKPLPDDEWLLCSSGTVPPEHIGLMIVIGGTLPDIQMQDGRVKAYMYAGNSSGDIPEGMCLIYASPNDIAYGKISGSGLVQLGASVTLTAAPNTGYKFTAWQENGQTVSRDRAYTFTATGNRALTAVFEAAATIAVSIDPPGGGSASGGGTYDIGTSVTVTAAPASGYLFTAWKEGGETVSTARSYTFTATRSRNLTAVFAVACNVSATVEPSGSGSVSGAGTFPQGAVVTVTAAAGNGFRFAAWKESGVTVSASASYSFAVTGNRSLTAVFVSALTPNWQLKNISSIVPGGTWGCLADGGYPLIAFCGNKGKLASSFDYFERWISADTTSFANYGFYRSAGYGGTCAALKNIPSESGAAFDCAYAKNSGESSVWAQGYFPSTWKWKGVAVNRSGIFAAVSYGTAAAYTSDPHSWTAATLPYDANWNAVAGLDTMVAVSGGNSNKAAYSTDGGKTWKGATLPSEADWIDVTYSDALKKFVAIARNSDKAAYSTDGITWRSATLPSSTGWIAVAGGRDRFVVISELENKVAYSYDGIIWTEGEMPKSAVWKDVTYRDDGNFVALSSAGDIAYGQ